MAGQDNKKTSDEETSPNEGQVDDGAVNEEYDFLDSKLDDLSSALDFLEQKNDDIHQKLKELLKSNREIRKELQGETMDVQEQNS